MKIGKILWIINSETSTIVPVRIVEKITKETIQGEKIEFVLETTSGKRLNLSDLKDKHYETIEGARDFLLDTARKLVDEVVIRAHKLSKKFVQEDQESDLSPVSRESSHDIMAHEEAPTAIELPDGTMARVRIKVPEMLQ